MSSLLVSIMEATAGRGGSLPVPSSSSQPPRKEWRAVSEHSSFRSNGNEDPEHVRLGKSDERPIYEEGSGPLNEDFCSITIDGGGGLSDEILQQRLQEIARQRVELQHMEIELRAQAIARSEILEVQNGFQAQMKEQADAASKLKEQLQEREQHIHELDMKLEEKDRELRAIKLDNEAAWAKDDLLREQNKELATYRRERDNSEAERAQHLKQIHDLQEHVQEKESQILAFEEQSRVAQETILYKDEQLRDAHGWITRVREMDATTMQAELRERTEQFNQYCIGMHRQYVEAEQHHLQVIRQLQLELSESRERNVIYKESAKVTSQDSVDSSSYIQNKGNQINANDVGASNGSLPLASNGNLDAHSYATSPSISSKPEHAAGVAVVQSHMLGMGAFIPPTQITALHPFVMHPQGISPVLSSSSDAAQSPVGHFQPISTIPHHQNWQQQQAVSDVPQNTYEPSQTEQNLLRSDAHYIYELPAERKVSHPDHPNSLMNQQQRSSSTVNGSSNEKEAEVLESNVKQYQTPQATLQTSNVNTGFHPTIVFASGEQKNENVVQDQITASAANQSQQQLLPPGQQWSASTANVSAAPSHSTNPNNAGGEHSEKVVIFPESVSTERTTNPGVPTQTMEPALLDERSLLACIVRAIPAGADGRIRISATLPNRLAKMLAPLHWHDYKKRYGKLDDFVAQHPELFVIEGDFIHLREGAQQFISATTAFAKVAAAAASSTSYSSLSPSVALTPVAPSNRHKSVSSLDSKAGNTVPFLEGVTVTGDPCDKRPQIPKNSQKQNGINFNISKGLSDLKTSVNSKSLHEVNGLPSEIRAARSPMQNAVGNGANKGLNNGRFNSGGKQQARSAGAGIISRR